MKNIHLAPSTSLALRASALLVAVASTVGCIAAPGDDDVGAEETAGEASSALCPGYSLNLVSITCDDKHDTAGQDEPYIYVDGVQAWAGANFGNGTSQTINAAPICISGDVEMELWENDAWPSGDDFLGTRVVSVTDAGGGYFVKTYGGATYQYRITYFVTGANATWTPWLDRDDASGAGDYELLADFVAAGKACPNPIGIQCQTLNGVDWTQTGEVYSCTPQTGGYCKNINQPDGICLDYRVRFLCP